MAKPAQQPSTAINPLHESRLIAEPYHNRRVAAVNDHEIRMSVMTSGFEWHSHPESDEVFLVIEGGLVIEFEDKEVVLTNGDLFTVPRGVVHRTRPQGARSVNLTFESREARTVFVCGRRHDENAHRPHAS
jgi:mannose-6-phosphate isomerase-like protein (cupin superfamily)